jgi:hypothetical protein
MVKPLGEGITGTGLGSFPISHKPLIWVTSSQYGYHLTYHTVLDYVFSLIQLNGNGFSHPLTIYFLGGVSTPL